MKTDDELKQIAQDIYRDKIFSQLHIERPEDVPTSFMVLRFVGPEIIDKIESGEIFFIYEYMDKAGPRCINGMPVFGSFKYLNKDDTEKMLKYYNEIRNAVKQIKVD